MSPATSPTGAAGLATGALALTEWKFRFVDDATERDYRDWHVRSAVLFTRIGMVGSLVAWGILIVGYWVGAPALALRVTAAVLLLPIPVITAALLVTYSLRSIRWVLPLTGLANAVAGFTIVGLSLLLPPSDLTTGAITVAIFFGFAVFRLRPAPATLWVGSYALTTQANLVREWSLGRVSQLSVVFGTCLLGACFVLGFVACVGIDRVSRQAFRDEHIIEAQKAEIERQRARADRLLENILPASIAERLKDAPGVIAERFEAVTVLFADVVGFTALAASVSPEELVNILDELFSSFDALATEHGVEKIKTIGDAYMAVAGVPKARADHAAAAARLALAMRDAVEAYVKTSGRSVQLRIGLASGPAVAGVIGTKKFAYDLWGDTVNTAARMESHGVAGEIHLADSTKDALGERFVCEDRGMTDVKGKGPMLTYLLTAERRSCPSTPDTCG